MLVELSEARIHLAEQAQDRFLVALWPSAEVSETLAISGQIPATELHISLAVCSPIEEMSELDQTLAIASIYDVVRYRDPLEGVVSGYGRFQASAEGEKDVFYASPDILRLAELRQEIVNCLLDRGVMVSTSHGFTPHITLAYIDPGSPNPVDEVPPSKLRFESVTIMAGSRRVDVPFWTPEPSVSLSADYELPLDASIDSHPARALFADFTKEWIPMFPKPGKYQHEIFKDLDFTSETYNDILRNFDNYVYKQDLPIRATHMPSDGGAIGWIRPGGLRLAQDGSIEAKPEWNELGKGLVNDNRFQYASAEFMKLWTNPVTQEKIPNVAVGLALVTRPHFKTDVLAPLTESEALAFAEAMVSTVSIESGGPDDVSTQEIGAAEKGNPVPEDQSLSTPPAVTPLSETPSTPPAATPPAVTPPAVTPPAVTPPAAEGNVVLADLTTVIMTAEQRKQERQLFADLTTRAELAERRATTAETRLAEIEKQRLKEKYTAEVMGRSPDNGNAWFGPLQENVAHVVSLAEKYGEDSAEVRYTITQKRNEASAIRQSGIFEPIALSSTEDVSSIHAQVTRLAEQHRAADPNLTIEAAINKAYEENPELYVRSLKK